VNELSAGQGEVKVSSKSSESRLVNCGITAHNDEQVVDALDILDCVSR
jgi:hypothetical protein